MAPPSSPWPSLSPRSSPSNDLNSKGSSGHARTPCLRRSMAKTMPMIEMSNLNANLINQTKRRPSLIAAPLFPYGSWSTKLTQARKSSSSCVYRGGFGLIKRWGNASYDENSRLCWFSFHLFCFLIFFFWMVILCINLFMFLFIHFFSCCIFF